MTIVFDRGELIWGVLVYVVAQFVVEWALQRTRRKGGE